MARKSRVEYAGACYHVINRGNYHSWIFGTEEARKSFLTCLDEVCGAMGWRLYAWCLMGNHYHLCFETPQPNLVEGMRWLQSTFAKRFNRMRKSHGHVFQGRYKALILDGDALGAVCHYIHLNPVRAGLVEAQSLEKYPESSFAHLWYPRRRRKFEFPEFALKLAGGLSDTSYGRGKYRDYLSWLSETDSEQESLGFKNMTHGWLKGTEDFKKSVLGNLKDEQIQRVVESEASEMREAKWWRTLSETLEMLGRSESELPVCKKGESWKVDIARYLREQHLVRYRWIATNLHMGAESYVQSLVSRQRKQKVTNDWKILQKHEKLD